MLSRAFGGRGTSRGRLEAENVGRAPFLVDSILTDFLSGRQERFRKIWGRSQNYLGPVRSANAIDGGTQRSRLASIGIALIRWPARWVLPLLIAQRAEMLLIEELLLRLVADFGLDLLGDF